MEKRNCEIGDLVVILDKNMHRSYQPLAIIIKIRHNRDDVVRVAKVKSPIENMYDKRETCVYTNIRRFITSG